MPLVVMCGLPCSGKSRRVEELVGFLRSSCEQEVQVVADDFSSRDRNTCYASSREEKMVRGTLKSSVERYLSQERIVILDSLNYIKGFRYELFCVSKHVKTPHCIVQCGTPADTAKEWNTLRTDTERYSDQVFDGLVARFEPPDSRNRWDNPLFVVYPEDSLPCQKILDTLLNRKPPPPNQSTQSQPLSSTSFLHELDRKTQEVISSILEAQRSGAAGDSIAVPGTSERLQLSRDITMAELRKLRRQFITYSKLHPVDDHNKIPTLFVQYLNTAL